MIKTRVGYGFSFRLRTLRAEERRLDPPVTRSGNSLRISAVMKSFGAA